MANAVRLRVYSAVEPGWSYYRDLLPHLASEGFEPELLISDAVYREGRGSAAAAFAGTGVHVRYVRVGGEKIRGRAVVFVRYMAGAVLRGLFGKGTDVNFFLTQPQLFFLWGAILKLLRRQRYVVVVMDMYPEVAVQAGMIGGRSAAARLLGALSRLGMRHADRVIAIGRCSREYLERQGIRAERIRVVPNWSSEAEVQPIPRDQNPMRAELGLGDRLVVMYSGNMGVAHYFEDILDVVGRFRNRDEVRFVFAGSGARRAEIETAKRERGLENLILLPFQPVEKLAQSLSLGDVHFISLRSGFEALVVPSKAYGVITAGRPIIYQGEAGGEIARMIREDGLGEVVPLNAPDQLEAAVSRYLELPGLALEQGRRAAERAATEYSRAAALSRYAEALRFGDGAPARSAVEPSVLVPR
jgi:colanic acid biosynthesis glycosyl transferase WcaI